MMENWQFVVLEGQDFPLHSLFVRNFSSLLSKLIACPVESNLQSIVASKNKKKSTKGQAAAKMMKWLNIWISEHVNMWRTEVPYTIYSPISVPWPFQFSSKVRNTCWAMFGDHWTVTAHKSPGGASKSSNIGEKDGVSCEKGWVRRLELYVIG